MTLTTLIVIALVLLLAAYLRRRTARRTPEVLRGTRVLVCSLGAETAEGFEDEDAKVYAAYYRHVEVAKGQRPDDFVASVAGARYDIVHLFCELDEGGDLRGGEGAKLEAGAFFDACRAADVKLLFIAGENRNEGYINMARRQPKGVALDVVRTIGRNGESFTSFLGELLGRMSAGKTLPQAWVDIAPQSESAQQHKQLPATYCSVGRAAVLLP
jgi:hypothetical protein